MVAPSARGAPGLPDDEDPPEPRKQAMSRLFLALAVFALPSWSALAQHSNPRYKAPQQERHPVKTNPCATYGPGFVKIAGTDTCIRIGAGVSVEGGGNVGR
jgi:hypothetical protein